MNSSYGSAHFYAEGFPIRNSTDQRFFAPPRSLSQLSTSFISGIRQGIHYVHLLTWPHHPIFPDFEKNRRFAAKHHFSSSYVVTHERTLLVFSLTFVHFTMPTQGSEPREMTRSDSVFKDLDFEILSTRLRRQILISVEMRGFEPLTFRLQTGCSPS